MRGFCLLLAVFATLYQLASAQSSATQRRQLIAEQEDIACTLEEDDSLRTQFEYMVRALHGVQPNITRSTRFAIGSVNKETEIRCFANRECSEDAEVVWCLYMYHPSEDIELCFNFSSGEISMTDYARHLGINEILYRETTTPQDSSLWVHNTPYFLSNSFLTCTVQSQTCSPIVRFHHFQVQILDPVIELSNVSVHNSSGLLLGQTLNVFLCIAEFKNTETFPIDASCDWSISDGNENITFADLQGCDPLQDSSDCFIYYESRIRFYQMRYNIRDCPLRTFFIYSWLVIENATEADAELLYSCQAHFTATNPFPHFVSKTVNHSLTPIYPSLEIISLETPSLQPGANMSSSPYLLKPDETLQWDCSVLAGEGDSLVWLLNGTVIPPSLDIDTQQNLSCSLDPSSEVFSISHETLELGEFQRQFTSTLMLCGATESTVGTYACAVNRTRGDVVSIIEIWSASVQLSRENTTKIGNRDTMIIIIVCAVCASTLLFLIIAAILICCCLRYIMRQRERRKSDWTKDIFVMDNILHITGASETDKSAKNQALFQSTVDPLEFPRNKLVFLNTILGKGTFGVVLQAKAEDIVKSAPHRNIVAVKTTREKAPPHEINNFWEELQLMKQMTPHGNVINLLGHCTTPGGPIYMIIEYARYGSLKDFLKECEQVVLQLNHVPQVLSYGSHQNSPCSTCSAYPQLVDKTQLSNSYSTNGGVFSPDSTSTPSTATTGMFQFPPTKQSKMTRERLTTQDSGFGDYSPQAAFSDALADDSFSAHTVAPLTHDYVNSKGLLYMEDVQNFALQIACGLKHLEESQIVHCDLAARNILIAEGFVLKIGDFGMARDVSEKEYYRKQGGRIPVKWTAPEALIDHVFTFKSDIWSFGVVLWEVLTYGQQPYPKLKIRHSWEPFINYLMEGNRLSQPKGCSNSIYDLMQSCWHSSPEKRPTADELVQILSQKNLLPLKKTIAAETSI